MDHAVFEVCLLNELNASLMCEGSRKVKRATLSTDAPTAVDCLRRAHIWHMPQIISVALASNQISGEGVPCRRNFHTVVGNPSDVLHQESLNTYATVSFTLLAIISLNMLLFAGNGYVLEVP